MATDDVLICFGADPGDVHLLADVRARTDAELLAYLAHRRRWRFWYRLRDLIARTIGGLHRR